MKSFLSKIGQEPTFYLFRRMWRFSEGNRRSVITFVILYVFANAVELLTPLIFAWFINEIQLNGVTNENIMKLASIISLSILTTLFFWLFHGFARLLERKNAALLEINYRHYFLTGTLGLGMRWHNDRDSGDTIDKINKATSSLYVFSSQLFEVFKIIFGITGSIIALYFFNAYIATIVFFAILIALYILSRFDKILVGRYKKLNEYENKIMAGIFDTISNISTVLILNIQKPILKRLKKMLTEPVEKTLQHAKLNEIKWFSGSIMFEFITVAPIVFYLFYELEQERIIAIGTITALYMYLNRMSGSFFSFSYMYESIMYNKAGVENAEEIEKAIEEISKKTIKQATTRWETLDIQGLNFSYENTSDGDSKHLNNINLTINRGDRIACIGESGSGKTTFLKVLHGLYESVEANLSLDQRIKTSNNFVDLALETMLVPQEPEVFSSTIRENITLGLSYPCGEISRVTDLAQFTDVIKQLPNGLDSVINEKGVNLSGGQKQRLALARAVLFARNKDIILLDESTSSVDPENESLIYENILKEFSEKTIIASIHKMNLLKYFNRILIFENGKIVDSGTFKELVEHNEKFKKGWEKFVERTVE